MNARKLLIAALTGTTGLIGAHLVDPATARAQSTTTGAIQGVVTDSNTGEKLVGVTVIATSPKVSTTSSLTPRSSILAAFE